MKWQLVGYYFDGTHSFNMYEDSYGETKMVKQK